MFDSKKQVKKENNSGLKIIPGMCCSIDPKNELKEKETSITHVVVIKRVKKRPFRNSIWQVRDIDVTDTTSTMELPEWRLWPENMTIIRYPDDMPSINAMDIGVIDRIIQLSNNSPGIFLNNNEIKRLKALHTKLKYYHEMRDV